MPFNSRAKHGKLPAKLSEFDISNLKFEIFFFSL